MTKTKKGDPDRILRGARRIHRYLVEEERWEDLTYSQTQRALALGRLPATKWGEVFHTSPRRLSPVIREIRGG